MQSPQVKETQTLPSRFSRQQRTAAANSADTQRFTVRSVFQDAARMEAERRRLTAYCARFVNGDLTVAEEIAQDALSLAWQDRDRLREAAAWQPWLTGIARNLCLRWREKRAIEGRRTTDWSGAETAYGEIADTATPDPLDELERGERAGLLDRALAALPRATHEILIDRYINDLSLAEIAAQRGVREETAAVQLHRGRSALRKVLTAPRLREEAIALGVVPPEEAERATWEETRLWCPTCGQHRLIARYRISEGHKIFHLRCPHCDPKADPQQSLCFAIYKDGSRSADVLKGVTGIRPAYRRIVHWWQDYVDTATSQGSVPCYHCGTRIPVLFHGPFAPPSEAADCEGKWFPAGPAITSRCPRCDRHCYMPLNDRAFMVAEAQQFWTTYPRVRMLPYQTAESVDGPVYVTRMESLSGSKSLEIVCDAKTLRLRSVHPT